MSRFTGAFGRLVAAILLAPVRAYRRFVSPMLPARCKYHPTCSAYAIEAVRELGLLRGGILAAWRLARCNPWSNGGYDPVSARRLFRGANRAASSEPTGTGGAPA